MSKLLKQFINDFKKSMDYYGEAHISIAESLLIQSKKTQDNVHTIPNLQVANQ